MFDVLDIALAVALRQPSALPHLLKSGLPSRAILDRLGPGLERVERVAEEDNVLILGEDAFG